MKNPRRTRSAMAASLCLFVFAAGCKAKEETSTPVVNVEATTAMQQAISEHITADAVLFPLAQAAIAPKFTAPVRKFLVQRGAHVKKGELLAVLENRDLEAASMDNRGSYDQALATYQTTTKAQVPEDYQKAESDFNQAKANLEVAQKVYDNRQTLFKEGAIPGRDLDTARANQVQAKAAYDMAEQHLASMKSVSHEAALKAAKGQLDSAEGKYMGAKAQLDYSEIRSPINGVVTDRPLYAGETAAAGAPLLTVMDTSALLAKLHLPQAQAQRLKVGAAAQVTVAGVDEPVTGKVTLISPALDPGSTTLEVWVRIENGKGALKAGTPAKVSITGNTVNEALVVPAASVSTSTEGKKSVLVIDAGVAHQRVVDTGIEDGGLVQILSGLKPGEQVVTTGSYGMDDGTKVKVVTAEEMEKDAGGSKAGGGAE